MASKMAMIGLGWGEDGDKKFIRAIF